MCAIIYIIDLRNSCFKTQVKPQLEIQICTNKMVSDLMLARISISTIYGYMFSLLSR